VDLFLIRHAAAVDETIELRDPYRHLTPHGRKQATSLGERLRWHDCAPTHIFTSPLVRAVQTAELVAAGLQSEVAVVSALGLAPGESERSIIAAVQALPADSVVVLVGHEPGLSGIAAVLLSLPDFGALAKAEAVRIADGKLRWRFAWDAEAPTSV
jgi:phosphohistidine phosphatase